MGLAAGYNSDLGSGIVLAGVGIEQGEKLEGWVRHVKLADEICYSEEMEYVEEGLSPNF